MSNMPLKGAKGFPEFGKILLLVNTSQVVCFLEEIYSCNLELTEGPLALCHRMAPSY